MPMMNAVSHNQTTANIEKSKRFSEEADTPLRSCKIST